MTSRPNVRRGATARVTYTERHKPVTIWLATEEHAAFVRHVDRARARAQDGPPVKRSVSGAIRELVLAALRDDPPPEIRGESVPVAIVAPDSPAVIPSPVVCDQDFNDGWSCELTYGHPGECSAFSCDQENDGIVCGLARGHDGGCER